MLRIQPLSRQVHDDGHDPVGREVGSETLTMLDAVLKNGDRRACGAEPGEPRGGAGGVIALGGHEHPVHGRRVVGLGQHGRPGDEGARRSFHGQAGQRPAGAEEEFMPAGVFEPGGEGAADGARSNDGDAGHGIYLVTWNQSKSAWPVCVAVGAAEATRPTLAPIQRSTVAWNGSPMGRNGCAHKL